MSSLHSRRNFLRGDLTGKAENAMHPPGSGRDFARLCDGCGACVRACPQGILRHSSDLGVLVDFQQGYCTFCGDCARACPTGALSLEAQADWPWRAAVRTSCLSYQATQCRSCEDACEQRAIRFRLAPGGRAVPVLDQDLCIGCGECAFTCPVNAVAFQRPKPVNTERTV